MYLAPVEMATVILPRLAAASTTWLLVSTKPSLLKKNPEPVPESPPASTEIETTPGITRDAKSAIEPGARSTTFSVLTKFPEMFDEVVRPIVAPTPPAIKAITTEVTIKKELV